MKQKKKNRKGVTRSVMYCPYCGSRTELRSADGIYHDNRDNTMLYVCKNYPRCDTYGYYYKIIDEVRKYNVRVRYFSFASASKCAEQIVADEKAMNK